MVLVQGAGSRGLIVKEKNTINKLSYIGRKDGQSVPQRTFDVPQVRPVASILAVIPREVAEKLCVLPLSRRQRGSGFVVTFLVPADAPVDIEQTLKFVSDSEVEIIRADRARIEEEIFKTYRGSAQSIEESLQGIELDAPTPPQSLQSQKTEQILNAGDSRAANILRSLLDYCIAHEASDLHLQPELLGAKASVRMNGSIYTHEQYLCPNWTLERIVQLVKVIAGLDTTIKSRPQDGSFTYNALSREIGVRVSILPVVHGERIVMRLLGIKKVKNLSELSYTPQALGMIEKALRSDDGLIVFAGSTGSGKTTALYGAINELKKRNLSISTIENPVEQIILGVSQTSINEATGVDYHSALRAIMRQDPDVVLIGETRDRPSADAAVQAALTGHLILTTVHGRNAFDCVKRLTSLNSEPDLVPDAIRLIVHQRLLPRLCSDCKLPNLSASKLIQRFPELNISKAYSPGSCIKCSFTGYLGRVPVTEVIEFTPAVSDLFKNGRGLNTDELKKSLPQSSYLPPEDSMIKLLEDGVISYEEEL